MRSIASSLNAGLERTVSAVSCPISRLDRLGSIRTSLLVRGIQHLRCQMSIALSHWVVGAEAKHALAIMLALLDRRTCLDLRIENTTVLAKGPARLRHVVPLERSLAIHLRQKEPADGQARVQS